MTPYAEIRCPCVSLGMAADTVDAYVRAPEHECRRMFVCRIEPSGRDRRMTVVTVFRKSGLEVIGIFTIDEIIVMASFAVDRRSGIFLTSLADMAGVAIGDGVHSHQRETATGVLLENIPMIAPVFRNVTIGAFHTKLISMNIGMAIHAGCAGTGKHQILMATYAFRP